MRTYVERKHAPNSPLSHDSFWLESPNIPSYLEEELAVHGLVSLTKRYQDGSEVTYTALEYECEWCGSYDHKPEACPNVDIDHEPPEFYPDND